MTQLLKEAIQQLQTLPPAEQDRIAQELLNKVASNQNVATTRRKPRTPGLAKGMIEMANDFNDPLPDSFWLGEKE